MNYSLHIETNPKIMLGKPVIKGTRLTVELIVRKLGEGASFADLMQMYEGLSLEQIQSCLLYASAVISNEEVIEA
jgi:uncharacterized protein (DUF433 family)